MSGGGVDDRTTWKERKRSVGPSPTAEDLYGELSFTAKLVRVDADNKYAWSHRQWALEALGKGYTDELGFCNEILASKRNIHNRLVWDQRFFAVKKCLEQGLMIIRSCEVSFATDHISWYPENENPWRYLRLLCKGEMEALAVSQRLHWALRNVFVDARDSIHAVTADKNLHNKDEGHHVLLFHSVNKRGCLFALDLVSDLLSHGYRPHKEVVDAIEDLFKEFEGPGLAKRVDSVLQKHRMEVMELSADLTRMMVINRPGGMNTSCGYTPLSDHLNNPTNSNFIWSKDRWVTAEDTPKLVFPSQQCGVGTPKRRPRPGKYSQLCGVAGFSPIPVYFFPEDPCFIEYVKEGSAFGGDPIRIQDTVQDTVQFTDNRGDFPPEYNGEYKNLPESLRKCCWEIINSPEVDFDLFSNELVFCEGHDNPAAWQVRRLVIHARKLDLQKEVENLELLSERSSDNFLYWHQRRWVSEKIGKTAVEKELEFTNNILSKDANNYHAWSHRQWVFEVLVGGVGWEEVELEYCNKFLEKDSSNCFAWNQRYFVGRRETTMMLPEEVGYAMKAIKAEPENEMPWTYLQSLMIFEKYKQEEWLRFNCLKYTCEPLLIKLAKVGERDAIKKKRVVNALKMLLFVLLHNFPGFVNSDTDLFCFFLNWPLISQTFKSIDVTWI